MHRLICRTYPLSFMSPISIKAGRKDLGSIRLVASDLDGTLIVGQFNA